MAFDVPTRSGRQAVEGEGASNAALGRCLPPVVYSKLLNADLVQVLRIKERQQSLHGLQLGLPNLGANGTDRRQLLATFLCVFQNLTN